MIVAYVLAASICDNFNPIWVDTVVAKFGSSPKAAASSLRVFNVSGAESIIELTSVLVANVLLIFKEEYTLEEDETESSILVLVFRSTIVANVLSIFCDE